MDPRYPIGKFENKPYSAVQKEAWLNDIRFLPQSIERAIENLDEQQLNTPYREGGWTVKQLIHHVADSHMNAYIRFKLGLTEDNPTIKPYEEQLWANLKDSESPVNLSITLLYALHTRWYNLLTSLTEQEWERTIFHPASQKRISLWNLLGTYAWHSLHHTAHITELKKNKGW
jgi:uncharacterized damage-inducible protein DinB